MPLAAFLRRLASLRTVRPEGDISRASKMRLGFSLAAIVVLLGLIAWAAHNSWMRAGELRHRLDTVHLQSFRIADHFEESVLELNHLLLRYAVYHNAADWTRFDNLGKGLDRWIDDQRAILSSQKETATMELINAAYDDYLAAARQIHDEDLTGTGSATHLVEFAGFEKQAQRVMKLSFRLAAAHEESMDSFVEESQRALSFLRLLLLATLILLTLAGGGLAIMVYGEMIAPLRVKLVESRAVAERHEKLASLGMLAAGVAHEIRNPLTAIKAWLFLQQRHLHPGSPEHADAEIIANEINRLENLVKDVILFARPSEPVLTTIAAGQPMREVRALLAPDLERAHIQIVCAGGDDLSLRIDPQQIKQVLINLVRNAADSIQQEGVITLRARREVRRCGERVGEAIIIEVADTGKGIPPEVEKRLFDPFFTTKATGTGLGLSIAARRVEKHQGVLQYRTEVNRGTTFDIVLPSPAT